MFFTKVQIPEYPLKITYNDKLMTLGSCFAENIGKKLSDSFFRISINPFGVLYNPISIANSIRKLLDDTLYSEEDIFKYQSLWHSFSHSSLFSQKTKEACLQKINDSAYDARLFLSNTQYLILTLGTAWVYEDIQSRSVVSNCHKLPAERFYRRRLSVDDIVKHLSEVLSDLNKKYPEMQIIFTVSPIRHWKDGAHENNVSKATLHLTIDELCNKLPFVHYFPAYEIQMDELRDYRFYASDMLHPSEQAVEYIWQRFSDTFFDDKTQRLKRELNQFRADLNHRPLHADSSEYQLFIQNTEKRKAKLIEKYPELPKLLPKE